MTIKNFTQYLFEEEREVFFSFGRMNPPTIGHGKVLDTLASKSGKADYKVYLSQSQSAKKDPLSYSDKVKHVRKMFPKHARSIMVDKSVRTGIEAAVSLYNQGYKRMTMVVGDDRVREFDVLLNKYNGVKARHGFYNFKSIRVISAGARDPDATGVEGMSASKQRENATKNDFVSFSQGVPSSMSNQDARKLFNDVRKGMGLSEERTFKNHIDLGKKDATREAYVEGKLFEVGDRVITEGAHGTILHLGSNYLLIEMDSGLRKRKWLSDVIKERTDRWYKEQPEWGTPESTAKAKKITPKENKDQDPDIKDRDGTQPRRYHTGLSKSTKAKRDAHFKKHGKKDDDDASAYKPAPGDADAKTKPSKYTKAVKRMLDDDAVDNARKAIDREKDADKVKHDRMLDRARIARAKAKNRETNPKENKLVSKAPKQNPVAKFAHQYNKAATHTDKKKELKKGYQKHKGNVDG